MTHDEHKYFGNDVSDSANLSEFEAGLMAQIEAGREAESRQRQAIETSQNHARAVTQVALDPRMSGASQAEVNAEVVVRETAMGKALRNLKKK